MIQVNECMLLQLPKSSCGENKASGLAGIHNRTMKVAVKIRPNTFEVWPKEGIFNAQWIKQNLVLLLKYIKIPGDPASYRRIYLLDTKGEIPTLEDGDGLPEYGRSSKHGSESY